MISQRVENIVMISYFHLKMITLAAMRRISFRGLGRMKARRRVR